MSAQFGVHIGPQKATIDELRSLWTWLDAAGADWISVWDHLYEAPPEGGTQPHYEAVAILAAIAADTKRARLGCLVFCAPYRNVGLLAKSLVTIDHLSGGRFEVGLGSGWHEDEAAAYGLNFPGQGARLSALEEQIVVLKAWFRGERVTHHGEHVHVTDASLVPGPRGAMPLWIGGVGRKRTLKLTGAEADGWNATYVGASEFRELNGVLDDWCAAAGRQPLAVQRSINLMFNLGDEDIVTARRRLDDQWGERAARVSEGALLGRPDDVMDQIAPYIASGADLVNIVVRPPWNIDLLHAYIEDIVPQMRQEWSR